MIPKFDRKEVKFYVGNPNITLISGKMSFVDDKNKPRESRFLALLSIPEFMELREVLDKFKHDVPKISTMRVLKTEFTKHYGLALEFAKPDDAQEFYEMYNNNHFNLIEESPIILRWISKIYLDLIVPRGQKTSLGPEKEWRVASEPISPARPSSESSLAKQAGSPHPDQPSGNLDHTLDMVSVERPTEYIFSISDNYQGLEQPSMMEDEKQGEHESISVRDCPICLEPLLSNSCIVVLCSHKFHVHCIQGVQDHTCPVCRYQQYPFLVTFCDRCSQHEGLWCCVICGFVGCGGSLPVQGHSNEHAQETSHIYAKPLLKEVSSSVRGIWDHSKGGFIHNLVYKQLEGGQVVPLEQDSPANPGKDQPWAGAGLDSGGSPSKGKSAGKKFSEVQDQINQLISEQLSTAKDRFEHELRKIDSEHNMLVAQQRDLKQIFEKELEEMASEKTQLEQQLSGLRHDNSALSIKVGDLETEKASISVGNAELRKAKKALEGRIEARREQKKDQLNKIKAQVSEMIQEIKDLKVHLENQKRLGGVVQPGSSMLILGSPSPGSKLSSGSQKKR